MFAFIATLLVGSIGTAGAQVNYTVYDGTSTSSYIPVYGVYCDNYLKCEYVIPADHLTAMNGSNISKLTYYLSTPAAAGWGIAHFKVYLQEVASSIISSFSDVSSATMVYEGSLNGTGETMEIIFDTPYTYQGGNLLVTIHNTTPGTYKSAYFYGQTINDAAIYGYDDESLENIVFNINSWNTVIQDFIPKTTFTVDELHGCLTPTNLVVSNITSNGATVTWTPGNTETDWVVKINDDEYPVSGTPSYTVTSLTPNTNYVASVKAVCGGAEESEYTTPGVLFTTLCSSTVVTESTPFTEDFNSISSGIPSCWDNAEGTVTTASYRWNYYATGVTGHCVRFNSYYPASGQYSLLKTPVLDLTAINNPMITFTHKNPAAAQGFEVMYTTDGSTYTPIATGLQGAANWTTEEIVVPALANATNVMFIFKGISNCGYGDDYIYLDDVMIGAAPTCPKPTEVTVSNITAHTADIAWTNGGEENAWTIDYNGTEIAATNPFTLTGLTPETSYTVKVKANCAANDESDWSATASFITPPSCPAPTAVTVSNITTTSADIAWTNGGEENAWTIDYNGTEIAATTNPFNLTGLNPSTSYTIKVKANCDADDESAWSTTTTFVTECEAFALTETEPYSENFDSYTATYQNNANGVIPICWGTISNGSNANTLPRVSTSYVPTSSKGLNFRSGGNPSQNCGTINIAYLPEFTNPQNAIVTFTYRMESATQGTLSVGYVTDLDDVASFVSASSVTSSTSAANAEIIIPSTIPAGARIAFQWEETSNSYYDCGIDNLVVTMAPACPKPTAVTVSNITTTSADIAWTNGGSENAWIIDANGTEYEANDNPFTLSGLDAATIYTVKVKAICSEEEESDWSATASFTTECEINTTFPYVQDFEATTFPPICWSQSRTSEGNSGYFYGIDYPDGAWARYTSTNGDNSTAQAQLRDTRAGSVHALVTGAMDFTYENGYFLSVDVYRNTSGTSSPNEGIRIFVNSEPEVNANATELAFISRNCTVASTVNSNIVGAETSTGWYTYELPITATGVNYIIFQGESQYGNPTYMDNVIVDETPTCPKPTGVTVSNITAHTADIAWTNGGTENAWIIDANGTEYEANDNPFTLTGLDAATSYTVKVKAICSEEDESYWSTTASFTTECETVVVTANNPFAEDFNTLTSGIPSCWDNAEGTVTNASYRWNYYATGVTGHCVRFNSYNPSSGQYSLLKTPVLDLTVINNPMITFTHKNPAAAQGFEDMYTTDSSTYTPIATGLQGAADWTTEEIAVPALANATNVMFIFKGISNCGSSYYDSYIFLDDVMVGETPTCFKPTDVVIVDSLTTANSAVVDWTPAGDETQWQVACNGDTTLVSAHPFTITGLEAATVYTVSVRAYCSDEDQSYWTAGTEIATECADVVVVTYDQPYHEGWEEDIICWGVMQLAGTHNWGFNETAYEGDYAVGFPYYENNEGLLISPVFDLSQVQNPELSFAYWTNNWEGTCDQLYVYYTTEEDTTWNLIASFTTPMEDYDVATYQLPNPTSAYRIAFRGVGMDGNNVYLDDINIFANEPCEVPANVTVENNIATWESEAENFNLMYVVAEDTTTVEVAGNTYTFEGLEDSTVVTVMVQAICGEDNTSDWSEAVEFTFTTEPVVEPCEVPANVTVENNIATWESEAENFNLMYIVAEDTTTVEVAGNTYTFEGLEDSTVVTVMVQAICDEDNTSDWSEAVEFTFADTTIGIHNYAIAANVYPNPAHNVVNVECSAIGANLSVYDMFGKVIMNTTIQSERTELNLSNVAPGVYMIRIANNNATTTVKVVKR